VAAVFIWLMDAHISASSSVFADSFIVNSQQLYFLEYGTYFVTKKKFGSLARRSSHVLLVLRAAARPASVQPAPLSVLFCNSAPAHHHQIPKMNASQTAYYILS